ncbi:jg21885 [Pararge aegeria aegeria]|uniref:Jg21885 protein n=1 Tax=Pararge aegeria aegeria TaxID=348720 RepID=A0A8S4QZ21_9NEOP|nr:jg21885 [Pararge aegeria aegeria]
MWIAALRPSRSSMVECGWCRRNAPILFHTPVPMWVEYKNPMLVYQRHHGWLDGLMVAVYGRSRTEDAGDLSPPSPIAVYSLVNSSGSI